MLIDREGIIRYKEAVGPGGRRNIGDLAAECEKVNGDDLPGPGEVEGTLYVKHNCGPSRAALLAVNNLHAVGHVTIKNVNDDAKAKEELLSQGGKDQAPCLITGDQPIYESEDIVSYLAGAIAPV